MNLTVAKQQYN